MAGKHGEQKVYSWLVDPVFHKSLFSLVLVICKGECLLRILIEFILSFHFYNWIGMAFHPLLPASGFWYSVSVFFSIVYFPFGFIEALNLLIEFPDEYLPLGMPWTHTNSNAENEISPTPRYTRPTENCHCLLYIIGSFIWKIFSTTDWIMSNLKDAWESWLKHSMSQVTEINN